MSQNHNAQTSELLPLLEIRRNLDFPYRQGKDIPPPHPDADPPPSLLKACHSDDDREKVRKAWRQAFREEQAARHWLIVEQIATESPYPENQAFCRRLLRGNLIPWAVAQLYRHGHPNDLERTDPWETTSTTRSRTGSRRREKYGARKKARRQRRGG